MVKCNNDTNVCNFKNQMKAHYPASIEVTGHCNGANLMPVNLIWISYQNRACTASNSVIAQAKEITFAIEGGSGSIDKNYLLEFSNHFIQSKPDWWGSIQQSLGFKQGGFWRYYDAKKLYNDGSTVISGDSNTRQTYTINFILDS
jgi:hypothetical protein